MTDPKRDPSSPAPASQAPVSAAISLGGVRQNNLKDVSLRIPHQRVVVFTGVSGAGKSSLVLETIAVESQRQLGETFSWYARNRMPRRERPEADLIAGLTATVVVDQRPVGANRRSTVGTMTDASPILRVLFSRGGEPSAGEASAYSFNHPDGMCPGCDGLGRTAAVDLDRLVDWDRSLNEGAIRFAPARVGSWWWQLYATTGLFDPEAPLRELGPEERELFLHGHGFKVERGSAAGRTDPERIRRQGRRAKHGNDYEGLARRFERIYVTGASGSGDREAEARSLIREGPCPACGGARLAAAALESRIDGLNIAECGALEITDLLGRLGGLGGEALRPVAEAAAAALRRIDAAGLGYLHLDRPTGTLSGGERQRLKAVRNLGSSLTGMTYVFDEPSVGLHPHDVAKLNDLLRALRDRGNTVLVVEHDRDVIAIADHVVDMGPGAGAAGGEIVFEGSLAELRAAPTRTAEWLRRPRRLRERPREPAGWLALEDVRVNNLAGLSVAIPEGVLTAVTGVSGSGKSTLVSTALPARHPDAVVIDQSGIGASVRATPATFTGVMDSIRGLLAAASGASPSLFSFNSSGRCPDCRGRGTIETDLAFMDPVVTTCRACGGSRYSPEALRHRLRGRNVAELLAMTIDEAVPFFAGERFADPLARLAEVGLGYLRLGQPLSELSGGESQRLKLAERLREVGTVFVFDEPTAGLHMADVHVLLTLFGRLVEAGNTVIVADHDLDVIEHADWVVDLGPGAGRHGGRVVFEGPPQALLDASGSHTAAHVRADLGLDPA